MYKQKQYNKTQQPLVAFHWLEKYACPEKSKK